MKRSLLFACLLICTVPMLADTPPDTAAFFQRVKARDAKGVAALLEAGIKPNARDLFGRPALWNAIEQKDLATVQVLLEHGADPNDPGKHVNEMFESGATLAMQAVDAGEVAILEALLDAGAKPDVANKYGMNAMAVACMAGKSDMIGALIQGKANVNATDSAGTPMLWMAVKGGSADAVKALLDAGAGFGEYKQLVIDTAQEGGNETIIALIQKAAGANQTSTKPAQGGTP